MCLALVGGGILVSRLDTVFPNVSVEGVALGGMTLREAQLALSSSPAFSTDDGAVVTVELPADVSLVISSDEAGLDLGADSAAQLAYDYGRDGGILSGLFTYIKCCISDTELGFGEEFSMDETAVRELIAAAADESREKLLGSEYELGEDSVTIIKGAGSIDISEDELYSLVETAFREGNYETVKYVPSSDEHELDLQELYDLVYTEPKNAEYDKETDSVTQSETGLSFDLDAAQELWDGAETGDTVVIPLIKTEPEVTTEELSAKLFADCLSQKTTSLSGSSSSRINNITKAAAAINGTVLNPGEEFSYNSALGQRTTENGYQAAGAYSNGEVVQEVGGGICQVSSTLYNCALYANLDITSRYCHYFAVSYVPSGLDATVSWPSPDFKFVNDRDYPIKIEAYTDLSTYTVTVKIWGTDVDGSYVQMVVDTWATSSGTGATSYRCVYDKDGNLLSKTKESDSEYHYHTEESPSPSPTESPSPSPEATETPTAAPTEAPTPAATTPPAATEPPAVTETPTETTPEPVAPVE